MLTKPARIPLKLKPSEASPNIRVVSLPPLNVWKIKKQAEQPMACKNCTTQPEPKTSVENFVAKYS
jgi:hypothetical protein